MEQNSQSPNWKTARCEDDLTDVHSEMQSPSKSSEFFGRNWQADAKINTEINNKKCLEETKRV